MKKGTLVAALVIVAGLAVVGFMVTRSDEPEPTNTQTSNQTSNTGQDTDEQTQPETPAANPSQQTSKVAIEGFAFGPASITVKKGTTVTWTNNDSVEHTVTPDNETDAFKGSERLGKNESYSFTFNTVGTYAYHCIPHPNMTATVTVTE